MKRHAVALLLQPYKNRLMEPGELKESINNFAEQLLGLSAAHPNFHCNVVLPAYILECIDPLLLSRLRDFYKRGTLEWLLTGYTEPFFSFFPAWLTHDNIRHGIQIFSELTGARPLAFLPPFSNWEPSSTAALRELGLHSIVLSNAVLPPEARTVCGYWIAEHAGDSIALFPSQLLHHYSAPADIIDWLEKIISRDELHPGGEKLMTVHYLLPLQPESGIDPYRWLRYAVGELDKHILHYQPLLMHEALSLQQPSGLQHVPACLPLHDTQGEQEPHFFLNRLHCSDQVGIMQRKVMAVCDRIASINDTRLVERLKRRLYFLQDINRFLPAKASGYRVLPDRLATYRRLIDIERELREEETAGEGRIAITDFLRNGNKSIILSNDSMSVYIDYKNGGHVYEIDYCDRSINLCAAFNPAPHTPPDILSPGSSCAAFVDRILPEQTTVAEVIAAAAPDTGNFSEGAFEYKIKKTASSVKAVLSRHGSFQSGDKTFPLSLEKVFGLEKNDAALSFVYQCSNHSLAPYAFMFVTELVLSLPGAAERNVRCINGKTVHSALGWEPVLLEKTAKWIISDLTAGVRLQFTTQKPLDVACIPLRGSGQQIDPAIDPASGIRLVLLSPVMLDQSSSWSLIGSLCCNKIRQKGKANADDAL